MSSEPYTIKLRQDVLGLQLQSNRTTRWFVKMPVLGRVNNT